VSLPEETLLPGERLRTHVTVAHNSLGGSVKVIRSRFKAWIPFQHTDQVDEERRQIPQVDRSAALLDSGQDALDCAELIVHSVLGDRECHRFSSSEGTKQRPMIGRALTMSRYG
jgi:hypothetical protein